MKTRRKIVKALDAHHLLHKKLNMALYEINHNPAYNTLMDNAILKCTNDFSRNTNML